MKKKLLAAIGIALSVCVAGAVSACGSSDYGRADDVFPFDAAQQEGYIGSEADWLADLTPEPTVYRRMWEEAAADGYPGTYLDFLKELELGDETAQIQTSLLSVVSVYSFSGSVGGAGVILSMDEETGDLEILTNYHVIYKNGVSRSIDIYLYGGENDEGKMSAAYVCGSADEDLALLRVSGSSTVTTDNGRHTNASVVESSAARPAKIGRSESILVGESVYAIGNSAGLGISVSKGVVSVDADTVSMDDIDGNGQIAMLEIRTDATVNHGNSGGGLFNAAGELVGIVNARSEAAGVQSIGYAIPVDHAFAVMSNLIANGGKFTRVTPGTLGITVEAQESHSVFDEQSSRTFISEKCVIVSVDRSGVAARLRMDVGDTILSISINGGEAVQITRAYKLIDTLLGIRAGDTAEIVVSRNGSTLSFTIDFNTSAYFATEILL